MAFLMIAKIWKKHFRRKFKPPNPIIIARLLQMFYFFLAIQKKNKKLIFSCPVENFGNIAKLPNGNNL
jgi:hypothetical protein